MPLLRSKASLARDAVRAATPAERALVAEVFGGALSPEGLTFRRGCWWPFQPAPLGLRALIVHEFVHVWQHRQGVRLALVRPPLARYRYRLRPGKPFARYGIEQQAEIVRDLWLHRQGAPRRGAPALDALAAVVPFEPASA
jgi:hypothetical protein